MISARNTLPILPCSQAGTCSSWVAGRFHSEMLRQGLVYSLVFPEGLMSLGQHRLNPDALISLNKKTCEIMLLVGSRPTVPMRSALGGSGNDVGPMAGLSQTLKD